MSTDIVIIRQMAGIKGSIVSSVMDGNARSMFVTATSSNEQATTVSSLTDGKIGEWKFSSSYKTRDLSFGSNTSERGICGEVQGPQMRRDRSSGNSICFVT